MGTRGLRRAQLGREVTEGTSVAATANWRGESGAGLVDTRNVEFVEEDIGYISGLDRTHIPKLGGTFAMDATPATFEQLPYLASASIVNVVTGTADGVGSGKIYTYTFNTNTVQAIQPYTIEYGDDQEAEEMNGAFVETWELTGRGGEAVMMSAGWVGRSVSVAAFTAQPAIPTVEDALFGNSKLFVDAIGGTIGTTQLTGTFLGASLKVNSGHTHKHSGDGSLQPSIRYVSKGKYMVGFDLTFEHDTSGAARKVDWRGETPRLVRWLIEGSALATAGTLFNKKTIRFDCAAKVTVVPGLDDQDGNDILVLSYRSRYNVTAARHASLLICNEVASLP